MCWTFRLSISSKLLLLLFVLPCRGRRRNHAWSRRAAPYLLWGTTIQTRGGGGVVADDDDDDRSDSRRILTSDKEHDTENVVVDHVGAAPVDGDIPVVTSSIQQSPRSYIVVSTVVVRGKKARASSAVRGSKRQKDNAATSNTSPPISVQPGCALFASGQELANKLAPSWSARFVDTENSLPLWHSLALLSELVVLVFESDEILSPDLVFALISGFRQRLLSAGLPKGRLLILLNSGVDEDVNMWVNRLADQDSSCFTSDILQQLFVANTSSFFNALGDILSSDNTDDQQQHGVSSWVDAASFPYLLTQVYESEGGLVDGDFMEDLRGGSILGNVYRHAQDNTSAVPDVHEEEKEEDSSSPHTPSRKTPVGGAQDQSVLGVSTNLEHDTESSMKSQEETLEMEQQQQQHYSEEEDHDDTTIQLTEMDHKSLVAALESLDQVQLQQQDNWLDPGSLPIDFAGLVNPILSRFETALRACLSPSARRYMEEQVGVRLEQLYDQHLKDLRDYFGTMYETLLDQNIENPSSWQGYAERVSAAFRSAGQASVPLLAQEGGVFRDMDLGYITAFSGLLEDMKTATVLRHVYLDDEEARGGDYGVAPSSPEHTRRVARWYEKLGARALVLAVNYFQGWLAWQGVKRAALDRERNLPKFPLF